MFHKEDFFIHSRPSLFVKLFSYITLCTSKLIIILGHSLRDPPSIVHRTTVDSGVRGLTTYLTYVLGHIIPLQPLIYSLNQISVRGQYDENNLAVEPSASAFEFHNTIFSTKQLESRFVCNGQTLCQDKKNKLFVGINIGAS